MGVFVAFGDASLFLGSVGGLRPGFVLVIGSSRTSTIPGLSVAGPSPEGTLLTPGLDAEYFVAGRVISFDVVPATPDGVPTPAVVSRAVARVAGVSSLVVDAGSYLVPRVPHAVLPGRLVGGRADRCEGLPKGSAGRLFAEARLLGSTLFGSGDLAVLGESVPGGTTAALGILAGLGYDAWGRVSSAGPVNPHGLKERVVREGLRRCGECGSWEAVVECVGDPVHPAVAGLAAGALGAGARVLLAGGTQMAAVLAIMRAAGALPSDAGRLAVGTTAWVVRDSSSDIIGLVSQVAPNVPVIAYDYGFGDAPYPGLRKYEEGYVKEGVGMGGLGVVASLKGVSDEAIREAVYEEYGRLFGGGGE